MFIIKSKIDANDSWVIDAMIDENVIAAVMQAFCCSEQIAIAIIRGSMNTKEYDKIKQMAEDRIRFGRTKAEV